MTARLSHAMHQALEAIAGGMTPQEAATAYGLHIQSVYRALSRDAPRCQVCGAKLKRNTKGLMNDQRAMAQEVEI